MKFLKTKKALLRAVGYENSAFDEIESITTVSSKAKNGRASPGLQEVLSL